jgi:hypothetical protein
MIRSRRKSTHSSETHAIINSQGLYMKVKRELFLCVFFENLKKRSRARAIFCQSQIKSQRDSCKYVTVYKENTNENRSDLRDIQIKLNRTISILTVFAFRNLQFNSLRSETIREIPALTQTRDSERKVTQTRSQYFREFNLKLERHPPTVT